MEEEVKIADTSFPFTNYTDKEFIGMWDSEEYVFPPNSTVKMLGMIPSASPQQIEYIRKKFAMDLAMEQFYRSPEYKKFDITPEQSRKDDVGIPYTDKDYAKFVQKCLEPLAVASVTVTTKPRKEIRLATDESGEPVTQVLDEKNKKSLVQGTVVA